jgi:arsenate reductase-like glutaredoxin family protein
MILKEGVLTFIYKGNQYRDKEALSYALSVRPHIHEIDITKDPLTPTQLEQIITFMDMPVEELVDTKNDLYKAEYEGKAFNELDWLTVLTQHQELLRTPIIFLDRRGKILESARDIIKFGASEKGGGA